MWLLRRCIRQVRRVPSQPITYSESDLSNLTFDKIEIELQLMNVNLAEANDIAMLKAFSPMPADLDDVSRKALRRLRDKMMERVKTRADI